MITMSSGAMAQDIQRGERAFGKCVACHSIGPAAQDKIGPQLNGLDGRRAGSVAGFSYSESVKRADVVWTDESFRDFLKNPAGRFPGTKMTFSGIKSDQEISDLWAYLKRFTAEGTAK